MSVIKTTKLDYKLKDVHFQDGHLVDENGEIVSLIEDMKTVFGLQDFTLTATLTTKTEYEVDKLVN